MSAGAFAVRLAAASVRNGEHGDEDAERLEVFGGGETHEPVAGRFHADHDRGVCRGFHTGSRHPRTTVRSCNVRLHRIAGDFLQDILLTCRGEARKQLTPASNVRTPWAISLTTRSVSRRKARPSSLLGSVIA
ncbi:hypothetical protein OG613_46295 (plasmid) [Streptomyces sp. NBC_00015]